MTILASLIAVSLNWTADRRKERKGQADQIRVAASESWDKLDRWREISSSDIDLDPIFVETSELLKKTNDIVAARDFLRKSLINSKARNDRLILDEKLEEASAKLYSYDPEMYKVFSCTVKKLKEAKEAAFRELLNTTQDVLISNKRGDWPDTAIVSNSLRETIIDYRQRLQSSIRPPLEETRSILFQIISKPDEEIIGSTSTSISAKACN